jgi:hypothetical protein
MDLQASVQPVKSRLDSWKITYSTLKDLGKGRMKSYDGSLEICKKDNFMILNNAKGKQIGYRFLKSHESLCLGAKLRFPLHVVRIGTQCNKLLYKAKSSCIDLLGSTSTP